MKTQGSGDGRIRVAVLGAGPAGLAAAYGLSQTEALRAKYEVTVYQVGWRAGGKVASGRQGPEKRLVMNGTHYLFGCYDNSFKLAKDAYEELEAAGDTRFGSFESAFIPLTMMAVKQFFQGRWHDWIFEIPTNGKVPGSDGSALGLVDVLGMGLQWLVEAVGGWRLARAVGPRPPLGGDEGRPAWWERIVGPIEHGFESVANDLGLGALRMARRLAGRLAGGAQAEREVLEAIAWLLDEVRRGLWQVLGPRAETDLESCRRVTLADLGCSVLIGAIRDDLFAPGGMAAIDRYDFRAWLARHGAHEATLYSPLVTGWYDAIASYEDGDSRRPNVSAGVTLNALLRAMWSYKGAFAYKPTRELGDSWVAPLVAMLRRRGVRFAFFHRVRDLEPGLDGARRPVIERIRVEQQVRLREKGACDYEPFIHVHGQPAWPDRPRYEQIDESWPESPREGSGAERLRLRGVDLEDFYTPWRGEDLVLERGVHFDQVVLALPIESLRFYCARILAERESWRQMVENVRGVDTRSLWLYFRPDLAALGWPAPPLVLTAYLPPYATWEEVSFLRRAEEWPPGQEPGCISSVFGPMDGPFPAPPPDAPGDYPERQREAARRSALAFLSRDVGALWPGATSPRDPVGIDWRLLVDLENREGPARFDGQRVSANYGPIQRYTLATAGALQYRLRVDESSYGNLYLAGDWTRNTADVGCVEGAVASGLLAAIAMTGEGELLGKPGDTGL
jgi:hypothetical protein